MQIANAQFEAVSTSDSPCWQRLSQASLVRKADYASMWSKHGREGVNCLTIYLKRRFQALRYSYRFQAM